MNKASAGSLSGIRRHGFEGVQGLSGRIGVETGFCNGISPTVVTTAVGMTLHSWTRDASEVDPFSFSQQGVVSGAHVESMHSESLAATFVATAAVLYAAVS